MTDIAKELGDSMKRLKDGDPQHLPVKVLIVDDNSNDTEILKHDLQGIGCEVDVANDGELAVSMVRASRPYNRIFLDLSFPVGQSGAEILRCIRRMMPKLPVAIFTGFVTDDLREVARQIDCEVIEKPAKMEDLKRLLGL